MLSKPYSTQQTAVGAERLRTLYSLLPGLPRHHFNLRLWRGTSAGNYAIPDEALLASRCGTQACAVGWAAAYPEFQAQGFLMGGGPYKSHPMYGQNSSWTAVEKFFGIGPGVADYLFVVEAKTYPVLGSQERRAEIRERLENMPEFKGRISTVFDHRVQVMRRILMHFYAQGMLEWGRYHDMLDLLPEEVVL